MASVKRGQRVVVDYWGTLDDGTQFDSSEGKQPLEFKVGGEEMIEGFDKAVVGMKPGETKNIVVKPDMAYGQYDESMVIDMPIEKLKGSGIVPKKGMKLSANGQMAVVVEVDNENVKLDFNHPLAGKNLHFKIKLVKIKE